MSGMGFVNGNSVEKGRVQIRMCTARMQNPPYAVFF